MRAASIAGVGLVALLVALVAPAVARADENVIKNPGDHPAYRFEAEPHALLGYAGPFEKGGADFGAGFRGTIIVADRGFISSINNSVGVGFGGDIFFKHGTVVIPVVMQWNFWLTTHWSVFAEPGFGLSANPEKSRDTLFPAAYVGGRYHFTDKISLTLRLGYPSFSVGASFFL
ncbi:MAG: hypothetical protein JWP87_948 [Labilithrix sp.]|jgi:hypothetical protein|nr:hypothetical protein [Labilithrix sp.]